MYEKLNTEYKYEDYSEDTLGEKIRKLRNIRGLTAEELGNLCDCSGNTIYAYESGTAIPHYSIMKKMIKALEVDVEYFEDDYYSFVLSDRYTEILRKWRKENTRKIEDVKKILGVSYYSYRTWEKGIIMNRSVFDKIKDKIL